MTQVAERRIVTLTPNPALDIAASVRKLVPDRKMRCENVRKDPGGGGINVARVIHRLGGNVVAVFPSGGVAGELVCAGLRGEGVPFRAIASSGETRENFNIIDLEAGKQFRFIFPGSELAPGDWGAALETAVALLAPGDFLVGSGSLPPGVPEHFYADMARAAIAKGAFAVVDASGPALHGLGKQKVHLLKVSLGEMGEMLGRKLGDANAWRTACAEVIAMGRAETVALSLGSQGALLASGDGLWRAAAPAMPSANAVGAGDSFLAAFVWKTARGAKPDEALRYAVAAGSAAMLSTGTGLCQRSEVERLARQIVVERVG